MPWNPYNPDHNTANKAYITKAYVVEEALALIGLKHHLSPHQMGEITRILNTDDKTPGHDLYVLIAEWCDKHKDKAPVNPVDMSAWHTKS